MQYCTWCRRHGEWNFFIGGHRRECLFFGCKSCRICDPDKIERSHPYPAGPCDTRFCAKCNNHGLSVRSKPRHLASCRYSNCACTRCRDLALCVFCKFHNVDKYDIGQHAKFCKFRTECSCGCCIGERRRRGLEKTGAPAKEQTSAQGLKEQGEQQEDQKLTSRLGANAHIKAPAELCETVGKTSGQRSVIEDAPVQTSGSKSNSTTNKEPDVQCTDEIRKRKASEKDSPNLPNPKRARFDTSQKLNLSNCLYCQNHHWHFPMKKHHWDVCLFRSCRCPDCRKVRSDLKARKQRSPTKKIVVPPKKPCAVVPPKRRMSSTTTSVASESTTITHSASLEKLVLPEKPASDVPLDVTTPPILLEKSAPSKSVKKDALFLKSDEVKTDRPSPKVTLTPGNLKVKIVKKELTVGTAVALMPEVNENCNNAETVFLNGEDFAVVDEVGEDSSSDETVPAVPSPNLSLKNVDGTVTKSIMKDVTNVTNNIRKDIVKIDSNCQHDGDRVVRVLQEMVLDAPSTVTETDSLRCGLETRESGVVANIKQVNIHKEILQCAIIGNNDKTVGEEIIEYGIVPKPETSSSPKPESGSVPEPASGSVPEIDSVVEPESSSVVILSNNDITVGEEISESGRVPGPKSLSVPEPESGSVSKPESSSVPKPESGSVPEPETDSVVEPDSFSVVEPEAGSVPDPESVSAPEPESDSVREPKSSCVPEPKSGKLPEPEFDSVQERKSRSVSEPKSSSVPEPKSGRLPEPEFDSVPEPESDCAPEPESDILPEAKSGKLPEPEFDSVQEPKSSSVSEPKSSSVPKPKSGRLPEPESDIVPEPESGCATEPEHDSVPEPKSSGVPEPKSGSVAALDSDSVVESESGNVPEPQSCIVIEPRAGSVPEPESIMSLPEPESDKENGALRTDKIFGSSQGDTLIANRSQSTIDRPPLEAVVHADTEANHNPEVQKANAPGKDSEGTDLTSVVNAVENIGITQLAASEFGEGNTLDRSAELGDANEADNTESTTSAQPSETTDSFFSEADICRSLLDELAEFGKNLKPYERYPRSSSVGGIFTNLQEEPTARKGHPNADVPAVEDRSSHSPKKLAEIVSAHSKSVEKDAHPQTEGRVDLPGERKVSSILVCAICGKCFATPLQFRLHSYLQHQSDPESDNTVSKCQECSFETSHRLAMDDHQSAHMGLVPLEKVFSLFSQVKQITRLRTMDNNAKIT